MWDVRFMVPSDSTEERDHFVDSNYAVRLLFFLAGADHDDAYPQGVEKGEGQDP